MTLQANAQLLTAEQFEALGDIGPADLVDGRIVYLTHPKPRHGRITLRVTLPLGTFIRKSKLGEVYAAETGFLVSRNPDSLRAPDVAFVRAELVAGHDEDKWFEHGPDLAVEVLSPNDRPGAVKKQVNMWLKSGSRSVWVIDPAKRLATIHHAGGRAESIAEDGVLRDDAVVPGFSLPLRDVF